MMQARRKQRITGYQVYDFTTKLYYAGESDPGTPVWSHFKRDAYRCTERDEAERLCLQVPPRHERRILELKARSY